MSTGNRLSLHFNEVPYTLELEDGVEVYAVLRELSGRGRNEYLDFVTKTVMTGTDGQPTGMRTYKGSQTRLLSACLYRAKLDADGQPVLNASGGWVVDRLFAEGELEVWPDVPLQVLFAAATDLSKLNESRKQAGND